MPTVHDPARDAEIASLIFGLSGAALDVRAVSKRMKITQPEVFEALARHKQAFDAQELAHLRGSRVTGATGGVPTYVLDGRSQTLRGWCAELGVGYGEVRERVANGETLASAVGSARPAARAGRDVVEHDGQSHTLVEWAVLTGLKSRTIRDRLDSGWTAREALTTPAGQRRQAVTALAFAGGEFAGSRGGSSAAQVWA